MCPLRPPFLAFRLLGSSASPTADLVLLAALVEEAASVEQFGLAGQVVCAAVLADLCENSR